MAKTPFQQELEEMERIIDEEDTGRNSNQIFDGMATGETASSGEAESVSSEAAASEPATSEPATPKDTDREL